MTLNTVSKHHYFITGVIRAYKSSLILPLFTEVPVPSYEVDCHAYLC